MWSRLSFAAKLGFLVKQMVTQAIFSARRRDFEAGEREMGFEPTTTCLEGRDSTAELLPQFLKIFPFSL